MNREIKFRVWDGEQMILLEYAGLQYFDFEGSYALSFVVDGYSEFWGHEQYEGPTKKAAKFPVMQFTGLKDKNGKDIYEGDILMYIGTNMSSMEVKFEQGCFIGEGPFNTHPLKDYLDAADFQSIEVIGNIYENPELSN